MKRFALKPCHQWLPLARLDQLSLLTNSTNTWGPSIQTLKTLVDIFIQTTIVTNDNYQNYNNCNFQYITSFLSSKLFLLIVILQMRID